MDTLVAKTRMDAGRNPSPTYRIINSQSVKTVCVSEGRGFGGGKKSKGVSGR